MPCLKPIQVRNPKYRPSRKNGYENSIPPTPEDASIIVPCGGCFSCRRRRQSDWRFRLLQEYKYSHDQKFHFVSFTFSPEALDSLCSEFPDSSDSEIFIIAVRRFLERYRKAYGVSLRHFFVSEFGDKHGRIHLHGIIVGCKCGEWKRNKFYVDFKKLTSLWSYGFIWLGWCNERSISYVIKYIMKSDVKPVLLVSPGFGSDYVFHNTDWHHSTPGKIWYCVTSTGHKIGMPRYYRLKIFSDLERENRVEYLRANPPPFVLNSVVYKDLRSYYFALDTFYRKVDIFGLNFKSVKNFGHSKSFNSFVDDTNEFNILLSEKAH